MGLVFPVTPKRHPALAFFVVVVSWALSVLFYGAGVVGLYLVFEPKALYNGEIWAACLVALFLAVAALQFFFDIRARIRAQGVEGLGHLLSTILGTPASVLFAFALLLFVYDHVRGLAPGFGGLIAIAVVLIVRWMHGTVLDMKEGGSPVIRGEQGQSIWHLKKQRARVKRRGFEAPRIRMRK